MQRSAFLRGPFRVPTDRNWSKQHPRIRTPRPLVDRFNLGSLHPNKEWWRERRIAPATFMGFPDVSKAEMRGGSLYVEQMDAATLAVIVDKCVRDKICNEEFFSKFSWRMQQLCPSVANTDVAYLFRGFSRSGWFDSHLALSLWGRIDWLLPSFSLADVAVVVQGYENEAYRNARYEAKTLSHMQLLLEARDDWNVEELCQAGSSLGLIDDSQASSFEKRCEILSKIAKKIDYLDLSLVPLDLIVALLKAFALLRTSSPILFRICSQIEEKLLTERSRINVGDHAASILLALFETRLADTQRTLVAELIPDLYDNIFQLSHSALIEALKLVDLNAVTSPADFASLVLLRVSREIYKMDAAHVCRILASVLRTKERPFFEDCVTECLSRIASTGLDKVPSVILADVKAAVENVDQKSAELETLSQLIVLSI